ncbi:HEPN/Toprim-associated domain-containing protein [Pantoea agglomerans]|uniref:HEPN/Toprim-associated domain-containing protein n=1 Tax=Enterobacter agglomerans TaxID=549 RepID=UPI003207AEE9
MSTWVGVEIDGLIVEDYQNHHSNWFFKRSDRVRENCERDECGRLTDEAFIGFRASGASIRRRMTLAGFDLAACEQHFNEHLPAVIEAAEWVLSCEGERSHAESGSLSVRGDAYRQFLDAVKDTSLQDWLDALPEAVSLSKTMSRFSDFSGMPYWCETSAAPLVNAMLSDIPLYTEYSHTDLFNFPCNDSSYFQVALLACCSDDVACELNIVPLIQSGWEDDFRDLEEIQRQETEPHRFSRLSLEETMRLSATQIENLSLQRMCYSSIITSMEAYLGDILKREIFDRPAVKELFVASYKPFKEQSFSLNNLYKALSEIDDEIMKALNTLSLHNIGTAKSLFYSTLMTKFPEKSLRIIGPAVQIRHDIVHRNGRNTKGEALSIDYESVQALANVVLQFMQNVDAQILDGLIAESCID